MTNMIKMDHGLSLYTSPVDANSFVYAPGLEYITFALLRPLELHLDIRFCRLISVLIGIAGAFLAALAMSQLARHFLPKIRLRSFFLASWGVSVLLVFKNFAADVPHPDNLHIFHMLAIFALTVLAVDTGRFRLAIASVLLGGLGVFTKQSEALAFLGPIVAYAALLRWTFRQWMILLAAGSLVTALSVSSLLLPDISRFYTLGILLEHPLFLLKVLPLILYFLSFPQVLLCLLALVAAIRAWFHQGPGRSYLICWASVGVFAVLPNLFPYLKFMGDWNNLVIFEVWLFMIIWPYFNCFTIAKIRLPVTEQTQRYLGSRVLNQVMILLVIVFLISLYPRKQPPLPSHFAYCRAIEDSVRKDLEAKKKVLVSHGATFLIRAGSTDVTRDRANSLLELHAGRQEARSMTLDRINARAYDKLYLIKEPWYGTRIRDAITANYVEIGRIPAPLDQPSLEQGHNDLMENCEIMESRTPRKPGEG